MSGRRFAGLWKAMRIRPKYEEIPICLCGKDWEEHLNKDGSLSKRLSASKHQQAGVRRVEKPLDVVRPSRVRVAPARSLSASPMDASKQKAACHRRFVVPAIHTEIDGDTGERRFRPIASMLQAGVR